MPSSPSEEKEVSNYEDARHLANLGLWAVDLQIKRLKRQEPEDNEFVLRRVSDFHFLVVALIRVRRSAELVNSIVDLRSALERFDRDIPNLKKMRDILEHIDDYTKGRGRDTNVVVGGLFTYAFGDDVITWSEYRLNLDTAMKACETLFSEIKANPPASYARLVAQYSLRRAQ